MGKLTDLFSGKTTVVSRARKNVRRVIKEGRLVFVDKDTIRYKDKKGTERKYTFIEMAEAFQDITGTRDSLNQLGVGTMDILAVFIEEYKRQEAKKN